MAENGKYAELRCKITPTGDIAFRAREHLSSGSVVQVIGTETSSGSVTGGWKVSKQGKTAVHVTPDGAVHGPEGKFPEIAQDNAGSVLRKTAAACKAGLDLRRF